MQRRRAGLFDFLEAEPPYVLPRAFAQRADPLRLAAAIRRLEKPFEFQVEAESGYGFLLALAKVKQSVPDNEWRQLLARLAPRADLGVLGG